MMHPTENIRHFLRPGVRVHMAGIGGVSMCALAEVLKGMGLNVQGSDMTEQRHRKAPAQCRAFPLPSATAPTTCKTAIW